MSEVTYFILYILQHNKGRHQPFWSDPLNPIFRLSLIFLSGDAPFSPCAGATLACAGRGNGGQACPEKAPEGPASPLFYDTLEILFQRLEDLKELLE